MTAFCSATTHLHTPRLVCKVFKQNALVLPHFFQTGITQLYSLEWIASVLKLNNFQTEKIEKSQDKFTHDF